MFNFLCKYLHIYKIIFLLYLIFNLNLSLAAFDFEKLPKFEKGVLHFEAGDKPAAVDFFLSSLRKGNPLGYAYLNSMKVTGTIVLPVEDEELFDNVPDICKEESSKYYNASVLAERRPKKGKKAARAARVERKDAQELYLEGLRWEVAGNNDTAFVAYSQSFEQKNLRAALGFVRLKKCPKGTADFVNNSWRFEKGRLSLDDFLSSLPGDFNINSLILAFGFAGITIEDIKYFSVATRRYFYLAFMRRHGISPEDFALAEYEYAIMLFRSHGGPENPEGARKYFLRAAEKEHTDAEFHCALMIYGGHGGPQDREGARKYYYRAAEKGNTNAEYQYAVMLRNGDGGPVNLVDAREYYRRAAEKGYTAAAFNYAMMLDSGEGGVQNLEDARVYYHRAAEKGDDRAAFNYAMMLQFGEGGSQNLEDARVYYHRVAEKGDAAAAFNYALMLFCGQGGDQDLPLAREYYRRAAEKGDADSAYNYALMLYFGKGGGKNLDLAREYFCGAAGKGLAKAKCNYALMLYRGEGGDKNPDEAISLLNDLVCSGFVPAIAFLSDLEYDRRGKEKPETKEIVVSIAEASLSDDEGSDLEDEPAAGAAAAGAAGAAGAGAAAAGAAGAGAGAAAAGAGAAAAGAGAGAAAAGAGAGAAAAAGETEAIKGVVKVVTINTGAGGSAAVALCDNHSSLFAKLTPEILAFIKTIFGEDSTQKIVPYLFDETIDIFGRIQNYCHTLEKKIVFNKQAKKDFLNLMSNPKTRICAEYTLDLIEGILRDPASRMGRPEKLRGELAGCMSRKISGRHRLVYSLSEDQLEIIRCAGHYGRL